MNTKDDDEIKNYLSKLLIFIIIVAFGYLSYYKFFIYDKRDVSNNNVIKKEENNKEKNDTGLKPSYTDDSGSNVEYEYNNIVENNDNNSNNSNEEIEEENKENNKNKIDSEDNNAVNDTSNDIDGLSTKLYNEIKKSIDEVPYTSIITSNISYKELYELYILTKLYDFPKDKIEFNYNYENIVVDKNGVKYADNNSSQYLTAKALGFTVDEIKKLHLDKWEHYINVDSGGSNYGIIDGKIMRDRAKKLNYDLNLNETKLFKLDLIIDYPHEYVIYEKDLDLYIIHFGDGIVPGVSDKKIILNGKLNDEILKINYVETSVIYDEECSIRNKDNKYEKVDAKCKVISEYDKDDFRKLYKYF